jgi:hypothetical protein
MQVSTLNNNVVPDDNIINDIENYTPKLSEEIVRLICEEKGFNTTDPRVYLYL